MAAGSSAAAMFPLFITHDEYFVRCGGSGGGTTMFLICPATNFLVDGVTAAAAHRRQRGGSGQRGGGVGSAAVVAAEWRQRGGGSVAMTAWRWWPCGSSAAAGSIERQAWQRSGAGRTTGLAGLAAKTEDWRHHSVSGGSRAAAEWRELCCRHAPPRWQQRHRLQQQWQGHYQQSTIN